MMEVSKIQKWGNSQGIRIPKKMLETLNLNQYENEEYSSLKFFKMYPNLMVLE